MVERASENQSSRVTRRCHRPLSAPLTPPASPRRPQAVSVRKHLDKFRQDKDAKFRLILIESRIHRLARYYKEVKAVAPNFKYEAATASTLVS